MMLELGDGEKKEREGVAPFTQNKDETCVGGTGRQNTGVDT